MGTRPSLLVTFNIKWFLNDEVLNRARSRNAVLSGAHPEDPGTSLLRESASLMLSSRWLSALSGFVMQWELWGHSDTPFPDVTSWLRWPHSCSFTPETDRLLVRVTRASGFTPTEMLALQCALGLSRRSSQGKVRRAWERQLIGPR